MMVCLIFYTAIIINKKNWRITIKLHFENLINFFKKNLLTHMLGPPLSLFVFVRFSTPMILTCAKIRRNALMFGDVGATESCFWD